MLELGAGADILRALGWFYIGLTAVLVGAALWFPKRWWIKAIGATAVLMVFTGPAYLRNRERNELVEARKARYEKAKALFDERCKTAGEKIYKIVDEVEGVFLLNVRPEMNLSDRKNPNWSDAALPNERGGDGYIANFLKWEHVQEKQDRGYMNYAPSDRPGYRYVDVKGSDGIIQRYSLSERGNATSVKLSKKIVSEPTRYAVSFINIVDPEGRARWIAGTAVIITDTKNAEVLATSTWYSLDPGQGNTDGNRSPWGFSQSCPKQNDWAGAPTRMFVDQVLKPKKGE